MTQGIWGAILALQICSDGHTHTGCNINLELFNFKVGMICHQQNTKIG